MSAVYDNWERLVGAVLRREQLRCRALRSFSDLSLESSSSLNSRASSHPLSFNYLKIFTFAELKSATVDFRYHTVLGERRLGSVFKGWVDEKTYAPSSRAGVGIAVTIKFLEPKSEPDLEAWQAEIEFLGKFSHPNIVKLLGYCLEDNRVILVFEDMQKGSLEDHLFRKLAETLSWEIRMKIAIAAAQALSFLHTTEEQVIHGDINAASILLDGDYNAKLLNFSLAKFDSNSHDIDAANTLPDWDFMAELRNYYGYVPPQYIAAELWKHNGYVAPEHKATGDLDVSSDVYSFGVMLLVIVSGR